MSKRRVSICKPTGGLVDLALVVDMDAVRRQRRQAQADKVNARNQRKIDRARKAAGIPVSTDATPDEKRERAELRSAWEFAQPGPEKRAALANLRAYERRHGMDAWVPPVRDRSAAIAESSERWG